MESTLIEKLKNALRDSKSIGVVVGSNPSLDQMAAALSLYLCLEKAGKKTVIASPTNPIVEVSSLVGIDKVQTNLGETSGDLIVTFPYAEGEIEKVSYTLENNLLNIVVKPGEKGLSFDEKDIKYSRSETVDLLFVIGASKISDLGDLITSDKLKNTLVVNIDNKAENQGFGDIVIVSDKLSSVSEKIAEILIDLGFSLDQDMAQNLLSGITSATDNFTNTNTSSLAFTTAGILLQKGATRVRELSATSFMSKSQIQSQQIVETKRINLDTQKVEEQKPAEKIQSIEEDKAPLDWLTPKVYKGGSGI